MYTDRTKISLLAGWFKLSIQTNPWDCLPVHLVLVLPKLFCLKTCWNLLEQYSTLYFIFHCFLSVIPALSFAATLSLQAWMSVQTTTVAAPTSAGTRELVMSVTAPLATNSWIKRRVEVKRKKSAAELLIPWSREARPKGSDINQLNFICAILWLFCSRVLLTMAIFRSKENINMIH